MQSQQYASSFISQTSKQPSYLLSSRVSRRKLMYQSQHQQSSQEIQDFKQQIQTRYMLSVANKIYTFPLLDDAYDDLSDEEDVMLLQNVIQYNLFDQSKPLFKKPSVKALTTKSQSKTINKLMQSLKCEKQRMINLKKYIDHTLIIKDKQNSKIEKNQPNYNYYNCIKQENEEALFNRKRLKTQPFEKPYGYIMKKK